MIGAIICVIASVGSIVVVAAAAVLVWVAHQVQIILFRSGIGGQDGSNVSRHRTTASASQVLRSNQHYVKNDV